MAMERERHTATLSNMGLRAESSLAKYLLLENCWENNLAPDISNVDYFEGHQGRTNLQPLDGLPLFVDNIYVFGYLDRTETVCMLAQKGQYIKNHIFTSRYIYMHQVSYISVKICLHISRSKFI